MDGGCSHNQPNMYRDLVIIIGVILLVLILREAAGWFFKTNHSNSGFKLANEKLDKITNILERNGLK
jgi:hypothetical protein